MSARASAFGCDPEIMQPRTAPVNQNRIGTRRRNVACKSIERSVSSFFPRVRFLAHRVCCWHFGARARANRTMASGRETGPLYFRESRAATCERVRQLRKNARERLDWRVIAWIIIHQDVDCFRLERAARASHCAGVEALNTRLVRQLFVEIA